MHNINNLNWKWTSIKASWCVIIEMIWPASTRTCEQKTSKVFLYCIYEPEGPYKSGNYLTGKKYLEYHFYIECFSTEWYNLRTVYYYASGIIFLLNWYFLESYKVTWYLYNTFQELYRCLNGINWHLIATQGSLTDIK